MSGLKYRFYFCLWCLCPAHSLHCQPHRAIHQMKAAMAAASLFLGQGSEMFPPCSPSPSGSGSYSNVKSSNTFPPKSCQEISQVECTHLSTDCKTHNPLLLSHHQFLIVFLMWERKVPNLLSSSSLGLSFCTLPHSHYFLFWRQFWMKT